MSTAWKRLSVAEFIDRCNWDCAPSDPQAIALRQISLANWQLLTTQEFFALQNWSGRVAGSTLAAEVVFDLTRESRQFWQCFNWRGEKKLVPERVESILEDAKEAIAAVEEFTLNDLSQLF